MTGHAGRVAVVARSRRWCSNLQARVQHALILVENPGRADVLPGFSHVCRRPGQPHNHPGHALGPEPPASLSLCELCEGVAPM